MNNQPEPYLVLKMIEDEQVLISETWFVTHFDKTSKKLKRETQIAGLLQMQCFEYISDNNEVWERLNNGEEVKVRLKVID